MNEERHWWAAPLGAAIVVILIGTVALIALGGVNWFRDFLGGSASGWAQAVGSVLAVAAAFKVGNAQVAAGRRLESERRAHDDIRRLETIRGLLSNAQGLCEAVAQCWNSERLVPVAGFKAEYVRDARKSIAAIDPFQSPAPLVVIYLAQIPRELQQLESAYINWQSAFAKRSTQILIGGDRPPDVVITASEFHRELVAAMESLNLAIEECEAAKQVINRDLAAVVAR